jgi:hypothetical protein
MRPHGWLILALATAPIGAALGDVPPEVAASAPTDVAVTIYRNPTRASGSMNLNALGGFALVSETRTVHLPAGESRLRFEGVADGIEAQSAIVTGLANGILEKNRDAALLSPSTLIAAALGEPVMLVRTDRKTGKQQRLDATILSDAQGGVVFKTDQGIEALRCSGLPETFTFAAATGLRSQPTLSVLVRTAQAFTGHVTLSYLARGFDWAADYSATVAADGSHVDLGAWVTLANGNGEGFSSARANVVAGRVNRATGAIEPLDLGGEILATCWPRGSTSDVTPVPRGNRAPTYLMKKSVDGGLQEVVVPAMRAMAAPAALTVQQEQLGDLKLYRVPERTTVASRQSKQVRLLDKTSIPVETIYGAEISTGTAVAPQPAMRLLRTRNDAAHHLGLPLPSGQVSVFGMHGSDRLLEHQAGLRDLAVDEDVEIEMGRAPDVQITAAHATGGDRVEITNARATGIVFELSLRVAMGMHVANPSRAMSTKNGRPLFRLEVPARSAVSVQYQLQKDSG